MRKKHKAKLTPQPPYQLELHHETQTTTRPTSSHLGDPVRAGAAENQKRQLASLAEELAAAGRGRPIQNQEITSVIQKKLHRRGGGSSAIHYTPVD